MTKWASLQDIRKYVLDCSEALGFRTEFGTERYRSTWWQVPATLLLGILIGATNLKAEAGLPPSTFTKLSFDQKLNAQVDLDLEFKDESGHRVTLRDYFGNKPVILDLGYYECPMLCTLVLNGMVQSLQEVDSSAGKDFQIVCVSISPTEGPALAAAKKHNYLARYDRAGADNGWHFLTGQEPAIQKLAAQVGFNYAYDPSVKQYAHPSGLVVLTPKGKIAKYLFGVSFKPKDLQAAITGAGSEQVGSPVKQLLILCFQHLPLIGKHSASVMLAVRIGAVAVVLGLVGGIALMALRNRQKAAEAAAGAASGSQNNAKDRGRSAARKSP